MNWDGKDRRKNSINGSQIVKEIEIRLITLETKFDDRWLFNDKQMDEKQKLVCQKLTEIKDELQYLKDSYVSLDKTTTYMITNINDKFLKLPCESRITLYKTVSMQIKLLWGFITAIVLVIVGEWFKKR